MSHQLDERIRDHATALEMAAPPIGLDDVRSATSRGRGRSLARPLATAAVVAVVVAGGLVAIGTMRDPQPEPARSPGPDAVTPPPVPSSTLSAEEIPAAWSPISPDPRGPTSQPATVWTGTEAIVIGGIDPAGIPRDGAAAYAPATDSWRTLSDPPVIADEPLIVWTGTKLLMIGEEPGDGTDVQTYAYAYDPTTDQWSTIAAPPFGSIMGRSAWAWTGTKLLVWPVADDDPANVPLSYDPELDSWNELPAAPIPPRHSSASVWTGTEWIIWGGTDENREYNDGAAYDPARNRWRTLASVDLAPRRVQAIWTGNEMILSAGSSGGDRITGNGGLALADGAAYNPTTDSWRSIAAGPAHPGFIPIWTGTDVIMFAKGSAIAYNVANDSWSGACCEQNVSDGGGTPLWTGATILLIGSYSTEFGGATLQPRPDVSAEDQPAAQQMSVDDALVAGDEFDLSFTGALRENRGGYFWLQEPNGVRKALLRSDGNPDIPMSYDLNLADASMLDDALSGETSKLVLPPDINPGLYRLCTANSATDVCIDINIVSG